MKKYDVVLLTEPRYENPQAPNWYETQILNEDKIVRDALEKQDLRVHRLSWDDPDFDWSSTRIAVFRTTWDYFFRFDEFQKWLEKVGNLTQLLNPVELIKWNVNKRYLLDLQASGIPIVPTRLVKRGGFFALENGFSEWDVAEIIIKPCVGGTARHTHRVCPENLAAHQEIFNKLVAEEDMLVQPFLPSVLERGEVSALMFGGKFSHAVLKIAKPGDFRVQDDFGGKASPHEILPDELSLAERVLAVCSPRPAYARVDILYDLDGKPSIAELEIIEPELFFRFKPEAGKLLADEILKALSNVVD